MKNLARQYDGNKKRAEVPKRDEFKYVRGARVRVTEPQKVEEKAT